MSRSLVVIGPYTTIDLPDCGIKNVPAKVDTGADSSAIWASNVHEENGMLIFTLFAPGSPFYTGNSVSTKDFKIRTIRNSFGHTELRYKVTLKTILKSRTINVSYTLASRGRTQYPILIGRRTLSGKFLVDVTHFI